MNNLKKYFAVIALLSINHINAQDLEVISSGGEYIESPGGSLSFTVGEVMTLSVEGSSNDLTQGFQQEQISVLSVQSYDPNFEISIFPNPTNDFVQIISSESSRVQMYDAAGRLVIDQIINPTEKIKMNDYERGVYQLIFTKDNIHLKTIKIVIQ